MDTLRIGDKIYYSLSKASLVYGVSEKTIYEWAKTGLAEKLKVGSASFFRKL
jgi:sortase (surface protein transpeptidase)